MGTLNIPNRVIATIATLFFIGITTATTSQSTFIKANNNNISYMGRIDFSNPLAPSFSYPGITISAKFNGTSIKAVIKDFGLGGQISTNYYNVIIDDSLLHKIKVNRTDTIYNLADGLSNTSHTVELIKRTESSVGKSSFKGFIIEADQLLTPISLPDFKMEFIGDSWTCGYGNEISTTSPNTGFHSENEDNSKAWGYTLAKRFNAQYHATALSGRGMYRNNTGSLRNVVPNEFNYIHSGNTTWNHSNYIPDVVLIHLGTNDFFPETSPSVSMLDSSKFVTKYINFIHKIRQVYGDTTKIICVFGNSKSDWWPENLKHLTRWRNYVNAVISNFNQAGDNEVYKFEQVTQTSPYGEDWHPTTESHNKMAIEISGFIKQLTGKNFTDYTASTNIPVLTSLATNSINVSSSPYPNPFQNKIRLNQLSSTQQWVIKDAAGKTIKEGTGPEINLEELNSGVYLLISEGKSYKVIKD